VTKLDLLQYLNENYLMLVPVLWILGFALKQTPHIPDWSIIWIISGVSLVIGWFAFGFSFEAFANGIIASGISVFGHQLYKQTKQINSNKK
jgi:hypothetical protein